MTRILYALPEALYGTPYSHRDNFAKRLCIGKYQHVGMAAAHIQSHIIFDEIHQGFDSEHADCEELQVSVGIPSSC